MSWQGPPKYDPKDGIIVAYYSGKTDRLSCFEAIASDESLPVAVRGIAEAGIKFSSGTKEDTDTRTRYCERLLWLLEPEWAADADIPFWGTWED